ncbi:MAG: hypothetical protein AAF573_14655 [Bacteroidota bacterium]
MYRLLLFLIGGVLLFSLNCNGPRDSWSTQGVNKLVGKGGLITTRFESFEAFKAVVDIEYAQDRKSWVKLKHRVGNQEVVSILAKGVSEKDIVEARDGSFWDKVGLTFRSPFFVAHRKDLLRAYGLSRRKQLIFGEGDIAFYDLAETMKENIHPEDVAVLTAADLSEKGFINTFNHINAQALMTTLFSEEVADFIADSHERRNMPELISGKFTEAQIKDIENGPVDNYVDIINNEWGQELGKWLKQKYQITPRTEWTPHLLSNYLNDLQRHYSWVFQIGLSPFRSSDQIITRFSHKINRVKKNTAGLE